MPLLFLTFPQQPPNISIRHQITVAPFTNMV